MLSADKFAVKEQVKFLKNHKTYDIFDPDTKKQIGTAEEAISGLVKMLRWVIDAKFMATTIEVREHPDKALVFSIRRGAYFFRSRVEVRDSNGELIGYFKSKLFSLSGGFHVYDKADKHFAEVKGNFTGFKYRVLTPDGKVELGRVSKEWGGLVKELFTSADSYMVDVADDLKEQPIAKMLVLASCLAVDMIFKSEQKGGVGIDLGD